MSTHSASSRLGLDKKQMLILGGIALALVIILILGVCLIRTGLRNNRYNYLYAEAKTTYADGRYDEALELAKQTLGLRRLPEKKQAQVYLLMADIYVAQEKPEAAIALLEDAYRVLKVEELNTALQQLRTQPLELEIETEEPPSTVPSLLFGTVEVAPDATSAILSYMGLTEETLAPVAYLTNLQTLNISGNNLSSLSAVSGLTELNYLSAADNRISDLKPLSGLTKLQTLYLDNNPVTDLSPLYGLSSLTLLSIKGIELQEEDMEALCKALPNCTVYADTVIEKEETEITIGGKTVSVDVTELDLKNCGITDLSELVKLKNIQTLDLQGNHISDLSPLSGLTSLRKLILWDNDITSIYPLSSLTNLTYLDLDENNISDFSPLAGLSNLRELWMRGNDPASLEPVGKLTGLNRLGLKNCNLNDGDLEWLKSLTNLWEIRIDGNDGLSADAVRRFQEALPNCTMTIPEGMDLAEPTATPEPTPVPTDAPQSETTPEPTDAPDAGGATAVQITFLGADEPSFMEEVGTVVDLNVSISGNAGSAPVWSSNDTGVATVDAEGVVTVVGTGHCTITVTVDSVSDTCEVWGIAA